MTDLVLASLNVINQSRVDQYINQLLQEGANQNEIIQKWIKGNLRNWLFRIDNPQRIHITSRNQFSMLGIHAEPSWLAGKELPDNLYFIPINPALRTTVEHALTHIAIMVEVDKVKDLSKISVGDAIKLGLEHIKNKERLAEDNFFEKEGVEFLTKCKNGFTWVRILTREGLKRETKYMGHCLGGISLEVYGPKVESHAIEIWSLRDKMNLPHCTIEVTMSGKRMTQIRGKGAENVGVDIPENVMERNLDGGNIRHQFEGLTKRYWKCVFDLFDSPVCKSKVDSISKHELEQNFKPYSLVTPHLNGYNVY